MGCRLAISDAPVIIGDAVASQVPGRFVPKAPEE